MGVHNIICRELAECGFSRYSGEKAPTAAECLFMITFTRRDISYEAVHAYPLSLHGVLHGAVSISQNCTRSCIVGAEVVMSSDQLACHILFLAVQMVRSKSPPYGRTSVQANHCTVLSALLLQYVFPSVCRTRIPFAWEESRSL